MLVQNSLIALLKHIFGNVINQKKKSFLIIYLVILVIDKLNNLLFKSFAGAISYLVTSIIVNIVLVYFYLASDDQLPLERLKKATSESFFGVFKIAITNICLIFMISIVILGMFMQSEFDLKSASPIVTLAILIPTTSAAVFMIGVTGFSMIHSIVEHTGVIISFKNGVRTAKENFWLLLKLMIVFIIFALVSLGEALLLNFFSLVLQLSFISITTNSINMRNAY